MRELKLIHVSKMGLHVYTTPRSTLSDAQVIYATIHKTTWEALG